MSDLHKWADCLLEENPRGIGEALKEYAEAWERDLNGIRTDGPDCNHSDTNHRQDDRLMKDRGLEFETTVYVKPSPADLAHVFWHMGEDDQALFFSHLDLYAGRLLAKQLQYVTDSDALTEGGRRVMEVIGEYAAKEDT